MRRTTRKLLSALSIASVVIAIAAASSSSASASVSMSFFYSNLSPHGTWHVSAQYGRVWTPAVYAPGWNPYLDGHWVYTEFGWTWVSDYAWGAIPYHYGTWYPDPVFGWAWVPGYVWAPSWVVFRTGPAYVGWAPVSPGYSVGVSFGYGAPVSGSFVFVSAGDFLAPRVRACAYPETRTRLIINNTRVVNNISVHNNVVVNRGPGLSWAENATRRTIRPVSIERVPRTAPGGVFRRAEVAVSPAKMKQGLRVSEPRSDVSRYAGKQSAGSAFAGAGSTMGRRAATLKSGGHGRYQATSYAGSRGGGSDHATSRAVGSRAVAGRAVAMNQRSVSPIVRGRGNNAPSQLREQTIQTAPKASRLHPAAASVSGQRQPERAVAASGKGKRAPSKGGVREKGSAD